MPSSVDASPGAAARATQAASAAARMRAGWLVALSEGEATLVELVTAATRDGGEPLLKIRLDDLLVAHAHLPPRKRNLVIARLRLYLGVDHSVLDKDLTLGWLTRLTLHHPASGLRRLGGMLDALDPTQETRVARVEGFPFTTSDALSSAWGSSAP